MNTHQTPDYEEKARQYILENKKELREKYGNKYIAVTARGGIIGTNENKGELVRRTLRFHSQAFITSVDEVVNKQANNSTELEGMAH